MPIEYEMKILKEIVENAIKIYSNFRYNTPWMDGIEYEVLNGIRTLDNKILTAFKHNECAAMRDLIRRGYWIKSTNTGIMLFKICIDDSVDYDIIINGAD